MAPSTVGAALRSEGLARLDRGDRAANERPQRYQRDRPGELIHVDVKKLAAIRDGGGWRIDGLGAANGVGAHGGVGYRFIHIAIDDRTRVAFSEILNEEQALTAAAFLERASRWHSAEKRAARWRPARCRAGVPDLPAYAGPSA